MTDRELMQQALEALMRGYLFFDVNGKKFLTYNAAKAERVATTGDVEFIGWHIFKGWHCFFKRINRYEQGGRNDVLAQTL